MVVRPAVFRKLCQARELLREVPDEALSIGAIAATVGISPAHFTKQFDGVFGVTPHQYRTQARLDLARQLLARGAHSVTDVCMEVGFASLGSFSTLFTRRVGESPSAYRRRMRPIVQVTTVPRRVSFPGCLGLMAQLPAASEFSRSIAVEVMTDSPSHV